MTSTSTTVAIYLRISDDQLDLRMGVGRQLVDCTSLASQRFPNTPITLYEDNDFSALKYRPRYEEMLSDIKHGKIRGVVAYNLDRLLRLPRELEALIDLCMIVGLKDLITVAGDIDLSTDDGQFHARILVAAAKKSSDDTSRRVARASRARNEAGYYHGGPHPLGFRSEGGVLLALPGTIDAINHAYRQVLSGATLHSIHHTFPALGDPPRTYARPGALRRLLTSPHLIGRTKTGHHPTVWDAFVDVDTYERVTAILRDPRRDITPHPTATSLKRWLAGLMTCECDATMGTQARADGGRRYLCRECWTGIDALLTETYIQALIFQLVEFRVADTSDDDLARAHAEDRRVIDAQLNLLAEDFGNSLISRDEWFTARQRLLDRRPTPTPTITLPVSLAEEWEAMDGRQRRVIAGQLFSSITVTRGTAGRFDPDRLTPHVT